jgi:uncharacterized membrane protein
MSPLGLIAGALCLAASLTPSLIPRGFLLQGGLAGVSLAVGYGFGVLAERLWRHLELPPLPESVLRPLTLGAAVGAGALVMAFLWRAAGWQNSVRARMEMPPVESIRPLEIALIAILVFVALLLCARLFERTAEAFQRRSPRFVPRRVARLVSGVLAIALFAAAIDGVLFRVALRSADASFQALDALIEPEMAPPADPLGTGSAESLIAWDDLGRAGREFVASGPTAVEIAAFLGRPALQPLRIYVGLNAAEDPQARAELALAEMIRVGAFGRKVLVVAVPTGTGWMDPEGTAPLEYLHGGDTAMVAVQYSYLSSPMSLLVEPDRPAETGRALFRAVYRHWTRLPRESRPQLYLHGLSLGAYGSEQSFGLQDVIADPIGGAVWSGPPFSTPDWRAATLARDPGSPAWLPIFGDSSIVRFTNQRNALDIPGAAWGPMRIVYLQYASDPITFFTIDSFWRKPAWMEAPLGPDVSPELRWYPAVSFLQLLLDMAIALHVPKGYGHLFAAAHYIDAWEAVTAPGGWTPPEIARLKAHLAG